MRKAQKNAAAWRDTIEASEKYRAAKTEAQKRANENGFDYGLEACDLFKEFRIFMLPQKKNRSGHELQCEVVLCENLDTCQKGHGPLA
jgi:hypothetical protein